MIGRKYYWVLTSDPESGKPYLIFGGNTEDEARQKGLEWLAGIDFEIIELPTRSVTMASQIIRGRRLQSTHSLRQAREKIGHNKSLRRLRIRGY